MEDFQYGGFDLKFDPDLQKVYIEISRLLLFEKSFLINELTNQPTRWFTVTAGGGSEILSTRGTVDSQVQHQNTF